MYFPSVVLVLLAFSSFWQIITCRKSELGKIPTDDPYIEPEGNFNVSLPPLMEVYKGSNHSGYRIAGLSKLKRDAAYDPLSMRMDFDVELPRLIITGSEYNLLGWIDLTPLREVTFPSGDMAGTGPYFGGNMTDFHLVGGAVLTLKSGNRPSIKELTIKTLAFSRVEGDGGDNFTVDGEPVDWKAYGRNFKTNFFQDWEDNKDEIVEKIRRTINNVIEKYKMTDVLALYNGEEDVIKTGMRFIPKSDSWFSDKKKTKKGSKKGKKDNFPSLFDYIP